MTVVVADTSPLNYLLLIGEIEILPALYGQVVIPPEFLAELTDSHAPSAVSTWAQFRPAWLQVCQGETTVDDPTLGQLDPGERAAIAIALAGIGCLVY